MAKKTKNQPTDLNTTAAEIVEAATEEPKHPAKKNQPERNPAAVALARLGGLKGGKARAAKPSPNKRKQIAKKAAKIRWRQH